jgi:outer membrane protein assembly factor BamB
MTRNHSLAYLFGIVASLAALAPHATASDWPFFRGPNHDGISTETAWSSDFPEDAPPIAWRRNVGVGAASMIVVGDHVFTMGNGTDSNEDVIYALNVADGSVAWKFTYANPFEQRQFEGGTAATPTANGGHLYTLGSNGDIHCLAITDGKLVWKRNAEADFGGSQPRWKYAGSPLVHGDLVILDIGGNGNSTLALDKKTGEKVWGSGADVAGYAPPIPFTNGATPAVLVFKGKAMVALALADGKELWRIPWKTSYDVNASAPFVLGDKVFISSGYPTGRAALFQLGEGAPTKLWENKDLKTKMNDCVYHDGHVYGISEKLGVVMCVRMADGEAVWTQKGAGQYGNLAIAGGKLIILTDSGDLRICKATPDGYERLAKAKILDKRTWVNPVIANGRIYCRDNSGNLACLDVRAKQ